MSGRGGVGRLVRGLVVWGLVAAAHAAAAQPAETGKGAIELGGDTRFVVEYQDDRLQVFYLLEFINAGDAPVDGGGPLQIRLPRGAAGAGLLQGSSAQASVQGDTVRIVAPFKPGKTVVQVGFTMPDTGETLRIAQVLPAALAQVFVAVERNGAMSLRSPQLTAVREMPADGQVYLMGTGGRLAAGETLTIELSGLPSHPKTAVWAVLAVSLLVLGAGAWLAVTPGGARAAAVARLERRRDALLGDLVGIERRGRGHALSPAEQERRERLTAELEQVMAALDEAPGGGREGAAA